MSGLRVATGALLGAFLLWSCGGSTTDSPSPDADAPIGGASPGVTECGGAAPEGGCNTAGQPALEPYARLHTACKLSVRINRRGAPVCIDTHIR